LDDVARALPGRAVRDAARRALGDGGDHPPRGRGPRHPARRALGATNADAPALAALGPDAVATSSRPPVEDCLMRVRLRGHRHRSLRTGLTVVGLAVAMTATGVATASALPPAAGDSAASIVLTEQATDRILVLASDRKSFENAEIQWEWRPSAANGLADL